MQKFHINKDGNPGKCSAQQGNCPFGDSNEHYNSIEEAYGSIQKLNPEIESFVKTKALTDKEKIDLVYLSRDPQELNDIAMSIKNDITGSLIATGLLKNPYVSSETLIKTRNIDVNPREQFINLELHRNFPLQEMSLLGARQLFYNSSNHEIREIMKSNNVNDNLFTFALSREIENGIDVGIIHALNNPHNNVSENMILTAVAQNHFYAKAAAKSQRFPTQSMLQKNTKVTIIHNPSIPFSSFKNLEEVPFERFLTAAQHNPNPIIVKEIYRKYIDNKHENIQIAEKIFKNEFIDHDTQQYVLNDIKKWVTDLNDQLHSHLKIEK